MPPSDTDTQIAIARMEENIKSILTTTAELKLLVGQVNEANTCATAKAIEAVQIAEKAKETVDAAFRRIDEGRNERQELVEFTAQLRGAGKAAVGIFGMLQAVFIALIIWLFSSVSNLREYRAVSEYRIQQLELLLKAKEVK